MRMGAPAAEPRRSRQRRRPLRRVGQATGNPSDLDLPWIRGQRRPGRGIARYGRRPRRERRVYGVSRRESQLLGSGIHDDGRRGVAGEAEAAMTRVVIVDDHPVVREGLVAALDVDVVGVFASAEEALKARIDAEVIVLDLELPGLSGLDAIA